MNIDSVNRLKNKIFYFVFSNLEKTVLENINSIRFPPIIIIGPARSGTTLVYQCVVKKFNLCYFTNLMSTFRYCPALVSYIVSKTGSRNASFDFQSNYGKTEGIHSPSQGNQIWGRWFRGHGPGLPISESSIREMIKIISSIEHHYDLPFVTKWPGFSVYLESVAKVFKKAVFIRVSRDPFQTIRSILKGRHDLRGGGNISISRLPSSYSHFQNHAPLEQVCAYVIGVEKDIEKSIKKIGEERFKAVDYSDLCDNPNGTMEEIKEWYKRISGIILKENNKIGEKFKVSNKLDLAQKKEIENKYNQIMKEFASIE